ncbi:MAG: type VI secretion system contractile sheath large subunit, partial [Candidatus Methylopumilus sp.]|nr:type VI secretion system contractile sheath large subunit [Candidatus Methylopumilus sp.]
MSEEQAKAQGAANAASESGSLIDQLLETSKIRPGDDSYSITKQGIQSFIGTLLDPERSTDRITAALADELIAELDKKLSRQVDQILHNTAFQKLESAWRSLKFLVDRTNFRENIKIQMMNVSKEDLLSDFQDSPEITKSGLYKNVYTAEFGQFGGQPFGAIVSNYEFGPGTQDVALLQYVSSVAAMAHAPFVGGVSASFFGLEDYAKLPDLKDLASIFDSPTYTKWRGFRESDDARNVALVMPHFLLRTPYGNDTVPAKKFSYNEDVSGGNSSFMWGNASFAFASRLTASFAQYRWAANIIGPQGGGAVEDLPIYNYEAMGEIQTKIPTEVLISERREFELAEQGFIALAMRKNSDNAAFFSANSAQKPKFFGNSKEGKEAETNYKLGTQLPYVFVVNRL